MLSRAANSHRALVATLVLLLSGMLAPAASAQLGPVQSMPSQLYFNTLPLYYDGDYRAAFNAFRAESRGSIKTTSGAWIDAIPYFTMAGESAYQLGQLQDATPQRRTGPYGIGV